MCLAQGPQRSDAGEARTRGPSVSSQALYHWATALPFRTWYAKADLYNTKHAQTIFGDRIFKIFTRNFETMKK